MMRKFLVLLVTLIGAFAFSLVVAAPAAASTSAARLGCSVSPGANTTTRADFCVASRPAGSYSVRFVALNGTGITNRSWDAAGWPIISGCTSGSDSCIVRVSGYQADQQVTVSLAATQAGRPVAVSATAHIHAVCYEPPTLPTINQGTYMYC